MKKQNYLLFLETTLKGLISFPKRILFYVETCNKKISQLVLEEYSFFGNFFILEIIILLCRLNTIFITTVFLLFSFFTTRLNANQNNYLKNTLSIFLISNILYFLLNKIFIHYLLSFMIPILLGLGISYLSNLAIRKVGEKEEILFYRGMPEIILDNIGKETHLNNYEINLLKDFYCKRMTLLQLSVKYNYSKDTIYYHKKKAIQKVKDNYEKKMLPKSLLRK